MEEIPENELACLVPPHWSMRKREGMVRLGAVEEYREK